ncbi:hypothetical protein EI42_04938 [Thermosporothrix hazakensis]|jgi:type IV secretory pathway VirB4 component|uniref:Uncharacterized protein n=2 Tax=Thermosporothrix TaxID=768650 RepID=A0A326U1I3_THEHA|nr:hypothetical protein [Thermosporothrix hazakensis]PZW23555.1 hypothetical protein EI42_04938 [Thermosporothrix hazakensis]BBH86776.1 hypothetical protein KTC_15270 [Thermosporothrix sp. COM3]GCE51079.1 hypothetical protein KTH_59480 [Thermosporothrix hazakensis]
MMTLATQITNKMATLLPARETIEQQIQQFFKPQLEPIDKQKTRSLDELMQEEETIFTLLANSLYDSPMNRL